MDNSSGLRRKPLDSNNQYPDEELTKPGLRESEAIKALDDLFLAQENRHLSEAEIIVIKGALNDSDYPQMAQNSRYSTNYLQRSVGPKLWKTLSPLIGSDTRVGKKKLRYFLETQITKKYSLTAPKQLGNEKNLQLLGGQPPDISNFWGRTSQLNYLKELIIKQRCVSLVGVAGIGKSALAAKLIAEISVDIQPKIDCVIWKSVAHAPSLEDLIFSLNELTQTQEQQSFPEYTQAMISVLIKQMQQRRFLVVLDAAEALFSGNFQRLEVGLFFRRLVEEQHDSCLVLTSRFLPDELDCLGAAKRPIQSLTVEGLDESAAMQLLKNHGLRDSQKCRELIQTYRGNPSELEVVANRIRHFFAGEIERFFENKTTLISTQFQTMLNSVFAGQVLSELQRQILIYLALELANGSTVIGFIKILNDLNQNFELDVSTSELIAALEGLEKQSLIESNHNLNTKEICFTLQPIIKKYILTDPQGLVGLEKNLLKKTDKNSELRTHKSEFIRG